MLLFNGIIKPINEHSFVLKAAKKLYFARSKEEDLFDDVKDPKSTQIKSLSKRTRRELHYHRTIKLKNCDNFLLYLSHRLGCLNFLLKTCWHRKSKFEKLYTET